MYCYYSYIFFSDHTTIIRNSRTNFHCFFWRTNRNYTRLRYNFFLKKVSVNCQNAVERFVCFCDLKGMQKIKNKEIKYFIELVIMTYISFYNRKLIVCYTYIITAAHPGGGGKGPWRTVSIFLNRSI